MVYNRCALVYTWGREKRRKGEGKKVKERGRNDNRETICFNITLF